MTNLEKVRLDKWLWAARFFKTRGLASEALKGGKVELNASKPKASKMLAIGDELKITQAHRKVEITVVQLSDKRGSAEQAQTLYRLKSEVLIQNKNPDNQALVGFREKGKGRPTKRERRQLSDWLGN
ncbi:RNA-binding S4 domain-containing protein [Thiomicrospira sp. ALE5]|uniref:RNA-binding S4 domain-containing protein n=1 Tax=Thiomicrospira sp. ALE5 TaxID=748650 RepID=UPI0008E23489|nr:RNA-binding S4 domain-containing protein [Thiomicrospira sp. ALE5]SFR56573.1 ribosome-associated heat shock protein Hsp15 [Thiomicrospira sp. ALE5]